MMEGCFQLKMKRKDLEDVNEDFSDFSLSSPARKIRRLDVELPPMIEEEERDVPVTLEQSLRQEQKFGSNESGGLKIEELPSVPDNEERAIVLFKPISTTPLLHSPSNFSVSVNSDLISGLKSQVQWSSQSNSWRLANDEAATEDRNSSSGNGCQAVVPWVPPRLPSASGADFPSQMDNCEMMDAEELGNASMDVEDSMGIQHRNANAAGGMTISEGLHQWQQQHCMIPQPPQNTTPPIFWFR
ncbi:hypothetical protein Pfo_000112 [Paulownia fortunei]|nr:hypothetical protein Pfo_000112 [Paulownia fortunei]